MIEAHLATVRRFRVSKVLPVLYTATTKPAQYSNMPAEFPIMSPVYRGVQ